jgi:hypothetical protein
MRSRQIIITLFSAAVLTAFTPAICNSAAAPKGGNDSSRPSVKDHEGSKPRWRADPEKGWVPAKERHAPHKEKQENSKQPHRKSNGSTKDF